MISQRNPYGMAELFESVNFWYFNLDIWFNRIHIIIKLLRYSLLGFQGASPPSSISIVNKFSYVYYTLKDKN